MIFTTEEMQLLAVYNSGSVGSTVSVVLDALPDIYEPDVQAAAKSVISKLNSMSEVMVSLLLPLESLEGI